MPADHTRILLVDDHSAVRTELKSLLTKERDLDIVGEATNGRDGVALAERLKPDVVVMDLSLDTMDGLVATRQIVQRKLPSRVLVFTTRSDTEYVMPLLEAGASGYLPKTAEPKDVVDAVRTVANGDLYVRPDAVRALAGGLRRREPSRADRGRFEKLTAREQLVLRLVAEGYSSPEIGEQLEISPKTVDSYKKRIEEKLGLGHRHDYVQFALRVGLLHET